MRQRQQQRRNRKKRRRKPYHGGDDFPRWMRTSTTAIYIDCGESTLTHWRASRDPVGPPWSRAGKLIFYDRLLVDHWLAARRSLGASGVEGEE
jgi:hypothetical protein